MISIDLSKKKYYKIDTIDVGNFIKDQVKRCLS